MIENTLIHNYSIPIFSSFLILFRYHKMFSKSLTQFLPSNNLEIYQPLTRIFLRKSSNHVTAIEQIKVSHVNFLLSSHNLIPNQLCFHISCLVSQ